MAGKIITVPLRVSLRSAQVLTHAAGGIAGRALSIAELAIGVVSPGHFDRAGTDDAPPITPVSTTRAEPSPAPHAEPTPLAEPPAAPFANPTTPAAAFANPTPPAVPRHVSAEPELVEESADPGAEEGAGAHITVKEPWTGYGQMNARDVIDRARLAGVAELAAIKLYEARHRARRTVLVAVERQLKLANAGRAA
jgi:hypothetical protein